METGILIVMGTQTEDGRGEATSAPDKPVVEFRNVSVSIPIYTEAAQSFRKTLIKRMVGGNIRDDRGVVVVRALEDVSFSAYRGESVGILGHNGSGKTTMLQVLAEIYRPTAGEVEIDGITTPYFGVNEGISPEMTGLEAIQTGCLVRGLRYRDIPDVMESIEDFAELGEFVHLPIRTYSAGMNARLLFAIATCLDPDILLIDENIGAGDERFQVKVRERVKTYIDKASLLFLAAHNATMLQEWCSKGVLMRAGRLLYCGDVNEAIRLYDHGRYSEFPPPESNS